MPRGEKDQAQVDLTHVPELVNHLKEPTRVVQYRFGSVMYKVLRGADDPTPDNVVQVGGLYTNLDNGRIGKNLVDVT